MKVLESPSMFFPMGKLANRIKFVRKQAGLSQEKFAEALGTVEGVKVTRGAVGNWELDKGISRENLAAISERFGVALDWLQHGHGELPQKNSAAASTPLTAAPKFTIAPEIYAQNARIGEPVRGFARIPIRGQGMDGKDGALSFNTDQNLGEVLAPPVLTDVPDAYAVYVIGDTMLERYRHGEVVYVHPYLPVREGDDCVIQISAEEGQKPIGYIKRFVSMDEHRVKVLQLNPRKTLTFPKNKVVAVHRIVMGGPV